MATLAPSLVRLRAEIDRLFPARDKGSDGWLDRPESVAAVRLILTRGWTDTEDGCREFDGYRNQHGYGQVRPGGRQGGLVRVHRLMYEVLVAPVPDGLVVRHACDNPPCFAPDHLLLGTQLDNARDRTERGRHGKDGWTACPNGHTYPPDRPAKIDKNRCRDCARERNRRYQARKKAAA